MGESAGPYQPEPGWETRWIKQALGLLAASPDAVSRFLFSVFALSVASPFVAAAFPGLVGHVLATSLVSSGGAFLAIWVISALMRSEGYPTVSKTEMTPGRNDFLSAVFLVNTVIVTISVMMYLSRALSGADPVSASLPEKSLLDVMLWSGLFPVHSALVAGIVLNPLWVALIPAQGYRFDAARITQMKMATRIKGVWAAICVVLLVFANVSMVLPGALALVLTIVLIAWLYVAAREIFGGITSNKTGSEETRMITRGA
jgi:hypothetical protein